jgi:hypothetical protein
MKFLTPAEKEMAEIVLLVSVNTNTEFLVTRNTEFLATRVQNFW